MRSGVNTPQRISIEGRSGEQSLGLGQHRRCVTDFELAGAFDIQ
jgi:hypothetical protein